MAAEGNERLGVILLAVGVEGALVGAAFLLGLWLDQPPLQTFSWDGRAALWGCAATVPPLLLCLAVMRWPVGPLRGIKQFAESVIRPILGPCTVLDMVGISLLAGLGEEMLFRGVVQAAFARWFGPWPALAAASVLFGILHAMTATYAVLAALMGAYLGWLWMWTGNLLTPIIVHGLYDLAALLLLLRGRGSRTEPAVEREESSEQ